MKVKPRHFPYPVLSDFSDDYSSTFKAEIGTRCGDFTFDFDIKFWLSDDGLSNLIKEGKAMYMVHFECPKTWKKIIQKTADDSLTLSVKAGDIHGQVDVCIFLVAVDNIINYTNQSFHQDFEDQSFSINKGEILAIGPRFLIDIEKEPQKNIGSIFQLEKNNDADAPAISVYTDSNKIVVRLSAENYSIFTDLKQNPNLLPLFHAIIAVPALAEAVEAIKKSRDQETFELDSIKDYSWYRVVNRRLLEIGEDIENLHSLDDSSFEIAQKLIDNPLTKALKYLENSIFEGEENDSAFE